MEGSGAYAYYAWVSLDALKGLQFPRQNEHKQPSPTGTVQQGDSYAVQLQGIYGLQRR